MRYGINQKIDPQPVDIVKYWMLKIFEYCNKNVIILRCHLRLEMRCDDTKSDDMIMGALGQIGKPNDEFYFANSCELDSIKY